MPDRRAAVSAAAAAVGEPPSRSRAGRLRFPGYASAGVERVPDRRAAVPAAAAAVREPPTRSRRRDACAPPAVLLPAWRGCWTGGRPSRPPPQPWENRLPAVGRDACAPPRLRASAAVDGPPDRRAAVSAVNASRGRTAYPRSQAGRLRSPSAPAVTGETPALPSDRRGRRRDACAPFRPPQSQARRLRSCITGILARDCGSYSSHRQGMPVIRLARDCGSYSSHRQGCL
jgi:hypothetical protein